MTIVSIQKAQTELDHLVARAQEGEEIILSREDEPAVRLMPVELRQKPLSQPRTPGRLSHLQGKIPDSFFDPLSQDELRLWEDGPIFPPEKQD